MVSVSNIQCDARRFVESFKKVKTITRDRASRQALLTVTCDYGWVAVFPDMSGLIQREGSRGVAVMAMLKDKGKVQQTLEHMMRTHQEQCPDATEQERERDVQDVQERINLHMVVTRYLGDLLQLYEREVEIQQKLGGDLH